MKNMRKILAAVLAVMMVLAMMPAAFAADTTYTLNISDLEDVAKGSKADGETVKADDYFTIVFSEKAKIEAKEKTFEDGFAATKRLHFGGKTEFKETGIRNAVKFTTSGPATVKVWWVGGEVGRDVAIHSEDGNVITAAGISCDKDALYVSELKLDAAGTYYYGNVGGNNYLFKLEVTEAAAAATVPATLAEQIAEGNKLANNEYLSYESTITGVITDEPQASSKSEGAYKFTVSDGTNSLLCYFVPVTGGTPKKGDTVTVTGKLTAYNGKAQFKESAAAATWISAGESAEVTAPTDPAEILNAAYALEKGATLPYKATLTGVITKIKDAYSEQYKNISVIITVAGCEDKPMLCYRLKGDGAAELAVGDTITVTGTVKNYNGTIEFDSGCTLDAVVSKAPAASTLATDILGQWTDAATGYVLSFTETTYETLAAGAVVNSWTYVWNEDGTMSLTDVSGVFGTCIWDVSIVDGHLIVKDLTFGLSYNCTKNAAPETPDAPVAPSGNTYTVKAGDTLGKIALAHYGVAGKYMDIFEANRDVLKTPGMIYVGQVLTLPAEGLLAPVETETLYTVQPGDTLGKIALAHYGSMAQYKAIFERNAHLASPDLIYVGQVIVLPAK